MSSIYLLFRDRPASLLRQRARPDLRRLRRQPAARIALINCSTSTPGKSNLFDFPRKLFYKHLKNSIALINCSTSTPGKSNLFDFLRKLLYKHLKNNKKVWFEVILQPFQSFLASLWEPGKPLWPKRVPNRIFIDFRSTLGALKWYNFRDFL